MNSLINNLNNYLPANRKERYYTGTVLPQIICHENFKHIQLFFNLIENFPKDIEIHPDSFNNNIQFLTEYSLKESANFIGKNFENLPKTKDTPDVVILITKPELFLIVIEAKMFTKANIGEFKEQIEAQKKVIECIKSNLFIKSKNIFHIGLVPEKYFSKNVITTCQMIYWEEIVGAFKPVLMGSYFLETLDYVLSNFSSLTSNNSGKFGSFGKNMEDRLSGNEIINLHELDRRFWVGRNRGLGGAELQNDKDSGGWQTFKYEVNFTEKSAPNRNWFSSKDFVEFLKDSTNITDEAHGNNQLDPWHFSYLGINYFIKVSEILGFGGTLDCPIKAIYTGIKGVEYNKALLNRKVNPNWWVLLLDGRQLKYGTTTGNKLIEGAFSTKGYKRTNWKEIKNYNW